MTILKAFLFLLLQLVLMVFPDLNKEQSIPLQNQVLSEKDLQGYWIRSFEDDYSNIQVYRLSDYAFPPARGRIKMDLKADGQLEYTPIAPDDRPVTYKGKWTLNNTQLILKYDMEKEWESKSEIRSFTMLGREGNILKLKGSR